MISSHITNAIGNTPVVKLNFLTKDLNGEIFAKIEYNNPGGSVKDRIAFNMVTVAENNGIIKPGDLLVEPTSGNTGIGLAMVAAAKGYRLILTMPASMSVERRKILTAYGASIELTPSENGMRGAIEKAQEIVANNPGSFSPSQFTNPANPAIHEATTGPEFLEALGSTEIDAFIIGVGTGGTLTGVARALKKSGSKAKIIAVEPENSPVISGGKSGPHKIQGIGAGFIPEVLDTKLIDEVITVGNDDAIITARILAANEGLFAGISSGAAAAACLKYIKKHSTADKICRVATVFPSNGERYLSTELFSDLM